MNSKSFLIVLFLFIGIQVNAQNVENESFIEVQGQAEMEVIPDEIYILPTISERTEGRKKIGIEAQEIKLSEGLTTKGIDLQTLSLADQDASYVPVKWSRKDLMASA